MKFSGNASFIDTMILSKFQVDCITPTDFGNFLNIGKSAFFAKFWLTEKGATFFEINIFEFFYWIIVSYTKGHQIKNCPLNPIFFACITHSY